MIVPAKVEGQPLEMRNFTVMIDRNPYNPNEPTEKAREIPLVAFRKFESHQFAFLGHIGVQNIAETPEEKTEQPECHA